ncbi:Nucleoid occlusion protein [Xylophilus ampelinus]|nr:Nucleoid occlusion protein [Xylophilus ampelinus]
MTAIATTPAQTTGKAVRPANGAGAHKARPAATNGAKAVKAPKTPKAPKKVQVAEAATDATTSQMAQGRDLLVPLEQLVLSEANVRRVFHAEGIEELAALIYSQGLLQRLAVVAHTEGSYAVVAGGRRLRAMQRLVAQGRWDASRPVECKLYDSARAAEVSLAENSGREAMHPADEMEAFRKLVEDGLTVAQVAGRFGVTPITVARRLKLARLAPRFLALYRAEEIDPDQLQALALTEDHAAQEAVWDGLPTYDRDAYSIRRALTEESCRGDSRLARFVGIEAYEARGGTVRRDLFAEDGDGSGVFLDDAVMLQVLAMEKLRAAGEDVRAEGWGWVECLLDGDYLALRSYGREAKGEREPTPDEAQSFAAMEAERDELDAAYERNEHADRDTEAYEAEEQRLMGLIDALDERIDAAHDALAQWTPEQMARGGALLRIDHGGQITVDRGLIRAEDRAAANEGQGGGDAGASVAPSDAPKKRSAISEKLMRDLTAHRTGAIQAALVQNPHVALVTLVHRLAETVFGHYGRGNDVVKVHLTMTSDYALAQDATDFESSPAGALLDRATTEWGDRLPGKPEALFGWLLAQDRDMLLDLLAYCTARSFNAVAGRERGTDQSEAITEALGVDMADWWVPTAASYLGAVSKAKALEAVKEATGIDDSAAVAGMKKDEAIRHCAAKLEGSRWLPAPLRRPLVSAPASEAEES